MAKNRETISGQPPAEGYEDQPAPQPLKPNGQHGDYWVLPQAEREDPHQYVRPVRRSYRHVGRAICGKPMPNLSGVTIPPGVVAYACSGEPGHKGDCHVFSPVKAEQQARLAAIGRIGGCDTVTTMALPLAQTYARDPKFYSHTFCVQCGAHLRVEEFVWEGTDDVVGQ